MRSATARRRTPLHARYRLSCATEQSADGVGRTRCELHKAVNAVHFDARPTHKINRTATPTRDACYQVAPLQPSIFVVCATIAPHNWASAADAARSEVSCRKRGPTRNLILS